MSNVQKEITRKNLLQGDLNIITFCVLNMIYSIVNLILSVIAINNYDK